MPTLQAANVADFLRSPLTLRTFASKVGPHTLRTSFLLEYKISTKRGIFLVLDVNAFERLLGPCREILERNVDRYKAELHTIFGEGVTMEELR